LVLHMVHVTLGQAYFGQTAAKYVLRMRVERLDGTRLGLWRSASRMIASMWLPVWFGTLILLTKGPESFENSVKQLARLDDARTLMVSTIGGNAVLLLLYAVGMGMAALHPQKRALHDLLAGSRVVYRID